MGYAGPSHRSSTYPLPHVAARLPATIGLSLRDKVAAYPQRSGSASGHTPSFSSCHASASGRESAQRSRPRPIVAAICMPGPIQSPAARTADRCDSHAVLRRAGMPSDEASRTALHLTLPPTPIRLARRPRRSQGRLAPCATRLILAFGIALTVHGFPVDDDPTSLTVPKVCLSCSLHSTEPAQRLGRDRAHCTPPAHHALPRQHRGQPLQRTCRFCHASATLSAAAAHVSAHHHISLCSPAAAGMRPQHTARHPL